VPFAVAILKLIWTRTSKFVKVPDEQNSVSRLGDGRVDSFGRQRGERDTFAAGFVDDCLRDAPLFAVAGIDDEYLCIGVGQRFGCFARLADWTPVGDVRPAIGD